MTLPFSLPDWVPWWLPFVVLVPGVLYLLAFLLMPFSIFGVKGRLEGVEARLDEIQAEIRQLALRLPEPLASDGYGEDLPPLGAPPGAAIRRPAEMPTRPPIPPPPHALHAPDPHSIPAMAQRRGREPAGRGTRSEPARTEPRLDWPG
jgi:hypothetical protein